MSMSNVDQVKSVLSKVNSQFTISDVVELTGLTRDQVSKALRSIEYVTSKGKGSYSVRGRRV